MAITDSSTSRSANDNAETKWQREAPAADYAARFSARQEANQYVFGVDSVPPLLILSCRWEDVERRGFLVMAVEYLLSRMATLNSFCALCDHSHLFGKAVGRIVAVFLMAPLGTCGMLKPTVCTRPLCCYQVL